MRPAILGQFEAEGEDKCKQVDGVGGVGDGEGENNPPLRCEWQGDAWGAAP